tara:strand:- start:158 stop:805 length:648 start_codon:yes stop_codon:yes gene_type:complete
MIQILKLILLFFSVLIPTHINVTANDAIIKSESNKDIRKLKGKKKRSKKGKRGKSGAFQDRFIKKQMNEFLKTVPQEHHQKAQKIITYLHTSHRVAKTHMKNKNMVGALKIFNKRLRLKVPDFFDQAPPVLKYFKLATKSAIGKIYLSQKNGEKAVQILEQSFGEAQKYEDFPNSMLIGLRHQLMRAYRMIGKPAKADMMLESALREAESELEFE